MSRLQNFIAVTKNDCKEFVNKYLDERNVACDHLAKRFLARKSVLTLILKNIVSEFRQKKLTQMDGLMEPLLKVAVEQTAEKTAIETEKKTLLNNIRSLMKKLNLSAKEAMDILDVPADKQNEYDAFV